MRFIYHHRTAGRGGEGNHIMSVVSALERAGHEVTLVSPPGIDPRRAISAPPIDKVAATEVGLNRIWRWISCHWPQILFESAELFYNAVAIGRVGFSLARHRQAVIYERCASFMFAGAWLGRIFRRRLILEVNEVTGVARARGLVMARVARGIERYVFRHADEIITVSSYLRREILARGGRPGHVHVMPNAIDPGRFSLPPSAADGVRERFGLGGTVVVGFVGWFDRWDRLELLIEMCRDLRPSLPELRLLLVGDGPVAGELRELTARYGLQDMVRIVGSQPRDTIPAFIASMDICVLPDSNAFGSPMVLFEFMALGRAIVAADVGGIRDVVQDGVNEVLVSGGDLMALTEAVRELAGDCSRRESLGMRARRIVLERHTWDATAARVVHLARGTLALAPNQRAEVA